MISYDRYIFATKMNQVIVDKIVNEWKPLTYSGRKPIEIISDIEEKLRQEIYKACEQTNLGVEIIDILIEEIRDSAYHYTMLYTEDSRIVNNNKVHSFHIEDVIYEATMIMFREVYQIFMQHPNKYYFLSSFYIAYKEREKEIIENKDGHELLKYIRGYCNYWHKQIEEEPGE